MNFFPLCLSSDYILNQQGIIASTIDITITSYYFLLYCISEIFWYKYNFASRAVNNSLEKTRSMCILLKNVWINIYYNENKLIISWSNQNSDCEVYSGFFKSLCVISYYWTLFRATMLPAKLSPPLPLLFRKYFFSEEEVKLH